MKAAARCGAVALLLVASAACEQGPLEPTAATRAVTVKPQMLIDPVVDWTNGNLLPESIFVCKDVDGAVPAGTTFDFTATSTRNDLEVFLPAFSAAPGECVFVARAGGAQFTVTVAEQAEAGFQVDSIVRYSATFDPVDNLLVIDQVKDVITGTSTASGDASGTGGGAVRGALLIFYNSPVPPPPPPGGGEGCTPGYWKQPHHFGNWTAPYTPDTPFGSVFADAFPGMSLLDVAKQGGGGLKALGRHTVAALLNAASDGVSYDLTVDDVIDGFNAAFASGDYESLKDDFAGFNEQGCSLGRADDDSDDSGLKNNGRGRGR